MLQKLNKAKGQFKYHWQQFVNEGLECFKEFKNPQTRHKQIPNILTASRLLAPLVIIPAALSGNIVLTGVLVASFALTDAADGYFARKYHATSEFGRKLDALTDKLFAASLLIPLLTTNYLMIILLTLEGTISIINVKAQLENNKPQTEIIGKIKTASLSATILLNYINMLTSLPVNLLNTFNCITIILQAASLTKYSFVNNYKNSAKSLVSEIQVVSSVEENDDIQEQKQLSVEKVESSVQNSTELSTTEQIRQLENFKEQLLYVEDPEVNKQKTLDI